MERVLFHVDSTLELIPCLLNPERVVMRRSSGVRAAPNANIIGRSPRQYDTIMFTGGGQTELELQLLFDIQLGAGASVLDDVRDLTAPLWRLTYNAGLASGFGQPPRVRLIWGKAWNVPGIITDLAEWTEDFSPSGKPQRSWVSLRLLQTDPAPLVTGRSRLIDAETLAELRALIVSRPLTDVRIYEVREGDRLPELAERFYGEAGLWRLIAEFNDLLDPSDLPPGTVLAIPEVL
ncbi:MAG: LysM peptidoglycan-binding domain-containing protein [Anaerolineae bacterium]|nr:LysM peptidoglycan-binding domain-containing protein [Anaerolineae bacterium]